MSSNRRYEYNRNWKRLHPENVREHAKTYYAKHRELKIANARQWYLDNQDYVRQKRRDDYVPHPRPMSPGFHITQNASTEEKNAFLRALVAYWRSKAIEKLGGQCVKCGTTDERILTMNHLNGKDKKHRVSLGTFYRQIALGLRSDIDLRCFNHNWLYEYERGTIRKGKATGRPKKES